MGSERHYSDLKEDKSMATDFDPLIMQDKINSTKNMHQSEINQIDSLLTPE